MRGSERIIVAATEAEGSLSRWLYGDRCRGHAPGAAAADRPTPAGAPPGRTAVRRRRSPETRPPEDAGEVARRAVAEACVPAAVVVSEDGAVLYLHGELGPYLHLPAGTPRLELPTMLRPPLRSRVARMIEDEGL